VEAEIFARYEATDGAMDGQSSVRLVKAFREIAAFGKMP
jgi:hypothetical protein